ncbi:hypothetical protein [Serratia ureilytica]|uniref:hypothetical protein n=1 Tax=Serratia ureilytica TaxID=300181 RepID=UPI003F7E4E0B
MTEKLDLFESGKNIVNEKFKGLFYGYFLTSLIAFNWDSLYFLAFSGKDAELKIKIVKYSFSLFHQLIAPALIGFALAIVSPYITSVIKKSHSLANRWMKSIDLDDENYVADHQADRNLARNKKIEQASMILEKINALENEFKNKKNTI